MALFKSGNPALGNSTFQKLYNTATSQSDVMTLEGTVNKTITLLIILISASGFSWWVMGSNPVLAMPLIIGGAIGGLICAIILAFNKSIAPIVAPIYAVLEGLFLGAISGMYEYLYEGIVFSAIILTFGIAFCLLMIYKMRLIKVTENFKLIVASATAGIALFYLVAFVLSLFHVHIPLIHSNGPIGIIFSLVVIAIAAANLVMDFDFIENGAEMRVPKYMEWYAAYGLMVTLVWLYLEILRLLSKLRSR
jgi:uncharacterized YccA/Bax inhibitor family protein